VSLACGKLGLNHSGEIHAGSVQLFLNKEVQSSVISNILKILIFLIQGFVFLLISLCFISCCMGLDDFVHLNYFQMDLACTHARFK
jgi:hypothetical protein